MSGELLVSCDGLSRAHGDRPLFSSVSFGVRQGDRIGLVGPNGSGKSTLLSILAGRESADSGTVTRSRLLRTGFVPQGPELDPQLSAEQTVVRSLDDLDLEPHEVAARVGATLGRAGLGDPSRLVATLSGGWRKRLAIAAELAREPDLLLLDEPTNHLDLDGILWLEELLASERRTCLVVSHDRWLLENVSTRVMELSHAWPNGLFAADGDYADFLERRDAALAGQAAYQASLANVVRREIEWLRRGPKARTTKSQSRVQKAERLQQELARVKERTATATAAGSWSPCSLTRARTADACCSDRVVAVRRGPTSSSSRSGRSPHSCLIPSAKRTVARRCRAQYIWSVACSAVIHSVVTVDRNGRSGGLSVTPRTVSANGSMIGSIIGE